MCFLPIPALIAAIAILHLTVKPSTFYEPSWLIPLTNTLFVTVVCLAVSYIAMKNYRINSRIQVLLLGCGVLAFGLGGLVAGFVRHIPETGANLNVTIYNTGALAGALFHYAAAILLLCGASPEVESRKTGFWLFFGYTGVVVFTALFTLATLRGMIPPFFIQGVGPTTLRQAILGSADVLFAFSFVIFMGTYCRNRENFLFWYSAALALTSISLTAFFIQRSVGSPVGWAGRFAQYLAGVYFLVALVTASRTAQARRTSLDSVITASLSSAEEKFRTLAEQSPSVIGRYDRELRHIYINHAGARLFGKPAGAIIGNTVEGIGVPEPYGGPWRERVRKVFETGRPAEAEHDFPAGDGMRYYQSRYTPEFGADGTVASVLAVSTDLTERKRTEETIRHQNLVLNGIGRIFHGALASVTEEELGRACLGIAEEITGSRFGFIAEIGPEGRIRDIAISRAGRDLCMMFDKAGHRGDPGDPGLHGIYGRVVREGEAFFTNDPASHPDRIGAPEGHPPLRSFLGAPLVHGGKTIGMVGVGNREGGYRAEELDALKALADAITQVLINKRAEDALRASLEEKEILLKELAHRTKNNMHVISSLIGLQAADITEEKLLRTLSDTQDRIRAMALVHEKLYRSQDLRSVNMKDYIEDLVASLLRTHRGIDGPVRTSLDLDDLSLSIDAMLPIGLIVNELVLNSLKHAFPAGKPGSILLSLRRDGDGTVLRYGDDGPGLPRELDVSRVKSLGLKLVYNLAVRQLRGKMELRYDPVTEFVFRFGNFAHMEKS